MKKALLSILLAIACVALPVSVSAQREAFPGAEGYGRITTGGRGGAVYHVTTLEDNNQKGSFRYACSQSGARTIVFDVSGTIFLKSALALKNGNVTIAGQTAPGDGICIADYPFTINSSNVIIRFMRFRLGNRQVAYHEGDGLGGMDQKNIIIDHCSVSWSIDECLSVYGSNNITVQWCIVSQSLRNSGHSKGAHGYGGNWGGSGASYHHNLMANHCSRTPRLGPRPGTQTDERMDMRNNVIYNYGSNGCYGGEGMNVNIVNNYYKPGKTSNSRKSRIAGPGIRTLDYCLDKGNTAKNYNAVAGTTYTEDNVSTYRTNGVDKVTIGSKSYEINLDNNTINVDGKTVNVAWNGWRPMLHTWGTFYVTGNYNPSDAAVTADNWTTGIYSQITPSSNDNVWNDQIKQDIKLDTPIEYVYTTTHTAQDAFTNVLAYAGASLHRDEYDKVITDDAKSGAASFTSDGILDSQDQVNLPSGAKGWPELKSTAAPADTDGDGMPDEWETANGLNPSNAADGAEMAADGFTNLEHYINSLVQEVMDNGNKNGKLLTANLTMADDAVELPAYETPAAEEFEISAGTFEGEFNSVAPWSFGNGITMSSSKAERGLAKGASASNDYLKIARNEVYTITVPEGKAVTGVTFTGWSNNDSNTSYIGEVNDKTFDADTYVFKCRNTGDPDTHVVPVATPCNPLTFKVVGTESVLKILISVADASSTGIEEVIAAPAASADTRVFNLMGVEVNAENLAPGIYIRGGKKFIVR